MGYRGMGAVVTGAGSGLGRALALELGRRGARVVVSDVNEEAAEETAAQVRRQGAEAHVELCDVGQWEAVEALEAKSREAIGQVDVLCNNAGVAAAGPFETISLEDWRWVVDIDLWGVIYGCRAFLPAMRERRRGRVLNVASAAGLISTPEMSPYNVSKAGVVALSETLYGEYNKHKVNISVLCPTFFQTNILDASRGDTDPKRRAFAEGLMRRSKVQAPDVAASALDSLEKGRLYCVPMRDGRAMWRLQRLIPGPFYDLLAAGRGRLGKQFK